MSTVNRNTPNNFNKSLIAFIHQGVQDRMCTIKAHYALTGEYEKEKKWII